MSRDWDAATYDRVSAPQVAWAEGVLDRLEPAGDERVLDAGCGSGRVTRMLLERLPRGDVVAVDQSASMVEAARAALPGTEVIQADLTDLVLDRPVHAVFSNAVFHWIADHDKLFARIHAALVPGGRLVAQCGGRGNVREFHAVARAVGSEPPYDRFLSSWSGPWNFAGAEETEERLREAGFTDVSCSLRPWPVVPPDPKGYLRSVCLGPHFERLPEDLRAPFVDAVTARVSELDYVRLDIDARRPG